MIEGDRVQASRDFMESLYLQQYQKLLVQGDFREHGKNGSHKRLYLVNSPDLTLGEPRHNVPNGFNGKKRSEPGKKRRTLQALSKNQRRLQHRHDAALGGGRKRNIHAGKKTDRRELDNRSLAEVRRKMLFCVPFSDRKRANNLRNGDHHSILWLIHKRHFKLDSEGFGHKCEPRLLFGLQKTLG